MDHPGQAPGPDAREALERLLLDGPRRYTRQEVAELSGVPLERTQRLWRALGFADSSDDDPAYSDADVAALATLQSLIDSGFVGPETEATIARAMGQALSRLADWQTDMLADVLAGAACVVVGNTGPAHVAAAVGTPVVSLFAPTVPAVRWRPWRVPHVLLHVDVPCAGCRARTCPVPGHPCLGGVSVDDVVAAVDRLAPVAEGVAA